MPQGNTLFGYLGDNAVAQITESIMNVANISIAESSGLKKKNTKPWWNEDCKQAEQNAWGIFCRYPTT